MLICNSSRPLDRGRAAGAPQIGRSPAPLRLTLACFLLTALTAYPQAPQASLDQLLGDARDAQNHGDFPRAARKYNEAAKLRPSGEIYEKLGLADFLANSYAGAVDAFSNALRIEPQRWASQLFLAESLYKLNRFEEALSHAETALQLKPDENESRYWLGCIDHALGRYGEAIVRLNDALNHDPKNVEILFSLTETYLDYSTVLLNRLPSGSPPQAKRLAIDDEIGDVASRAQDAGSWDRAVDELRAMAGKNAGTLKTDEPEPAALFKLSRIYGHLGQITAEQVWKLQPGSYRAHELRGESYEDQKNYEAALREYREALRLNASAPGLHYSVGHAYWEMKQLNDAVPELGKELALNPNHASANYVLGHIYLRLDPQHPEKAATYLQRAVEAKPDFVEARKQWGRALSLMHENRKAVEQLELAAKQDPRDDAVHYLLAGVYKSMGLEDKARQEFEAFEQLRTEKCASGETSQ